ncbi:MAG: DUF3667 domain-containing protein [Verrucomicrobiota bacterium]
MSDETTQIIAGDTLAAASEEYPGARKGFFGRRKRSRKGSFSFTHCENCGTPLRGQYCSACGQAAIDYRRSFRHVIIDVLDSFLNWDSKFIATIGWLIVRPWYLTNNFLAGRRVRYLHPLRLYLLASILFFFAVTYLTKSAHIQSPLTPETRAQIEEQLKREDLPPKVRAKMEKKLKNATLPTEAVADLEKEMKREVLPPEARAEMEKALNKAPVEGDSALLQFDHPPEGSFGKWLQARAKEKVGEHGTNLQLFLLALFSNLPYMMLCCIPLFAFVLKVLYIRRGIFYIDHLVYALHIHTFAYVAIMLIVAATMGLNRIAPGLLAGWIIGFLWLGFAVQIFLSIRRVYRQGWFFSIFKFFVGGFVYFIVLSMALAITFLITLALP